MNEQTGISKEEVAARLLPLLDAQSKLESMTNEELVKLLYDHLLDTTTGVMTSVVMQAMNRLAPNWLTLAKAWDDEEA